MVIVCLAWWVCLVTQIDKVLGCRYSDDWGRQNLEPTGESDTDGEPCALCCICGDGARGVPPA